MKFILLLALLIATWLMFLSAAQKVSSDIVALLMIGWFLMTIIYTFAWHIYRKWVKPQALSSLSRATISAVIFLLIAVITCGVVPAETLNNGFSVTLITGIIFLIPFFIVHPSLKKAILDDLPF